MSAVREYADVAVDHLGSVHLLARYPGAIDVFDSSGQQTGRLAEGRLSERPHGLTIGPDGMLYVADDPQHVIRILTPSGRPAGTLGRRGVASDTGLDESLPVPQWTATVQRAAGPFNHPTKVAVGRDGELFVADGYGNARIHRYEQVGQRWRRVLSWGEPGVGPGQFHLPHAVLVLGDGRVAVADRENDRVQLFDGHGGFLGAWTSVRRPTALAESADGTVLVAELGWAAGSVSARRGPIGRDEPARITALTLDGAVLARRTRLGRAPHQHRLVAPHGIAIDPTGGVHLVEVTYSLTGRRADRTVHHFRFDVTGRARGPAQDEMRLPA